MIAALIALACVAVSAIVACVLVARAQRDTLARVTEAQQRSLSEVSKASRDALTAVTDVQQRTLTDVSRYLDEAHRAANERMAAVEDKAFTYLGMDHLRLREQARADAESKLEEAEILALNEYDQDALQRDLADEGLDYEALTPQDMLDALPRRS